MDAAGFEVQSTSDLTGVELAGAANEAAALAAGAGADAAAEALALLVAALREEGVEQPAASGLADVVAGRVEPERWAASVMQPTRPRRSRAA
jgi:glycerol-3-phosphate dehydrogenase (NAD(P)+)